MPATATRRKRARYELREGFRLPVAGDVIGREVEALKRSCAGHVTPDDVIEAARPEDAPLHPCIEWDEKRAARLYQEHQAGYVIRSYYVVREDDDGAEEKTIANVHVTLADVGPAYISSARAMSDEETRDQVIEEIRGMLLGVRSRARHLPGLADEMHRLVDEVFG